MFIFMSNLFPARCGCVYVSPTNFRSFSPGHTKDLAVSPLSLSSSNHFPSSYAVFRFSTPHLYTCIGPCLLLPGRFSRQLFSVFTVFTSAVAHTYKPKEKPDAPEDYLFLYTIVNSAEKTPPHRKEINPNQQRFVERCPPAGFYRLRFYVFLSHSYQRVSKFTRNFMLHAIKKIWFLRRNSHRVRSADD